MPIDYSEIANEVNGALLEVQDANTPTQTEVIRKGENTGTNRDPVYGEPTRHPVTSFFSQFTSNEIDGTNILAEDIKLLLSPIGLPENFDSNDEIEIDGTRYSIINVMPVRPGGVDVLVPIQVRL